MAINASAKGNQEYDLIPQGITPAICYSVYDLGTQEYMWQGKLKTPWQVVFIWELPEYLIDIEYEDGTTEEMPRVISQIFTVSLHKKSNLRPFLVAWRGREFTKQEEDAFDLKNVLGVNCNLQILHETGNNSKTYANVINAMPLMDGQAKLEPRNPVRYFSLTEEMGIPEECPEWISDKIQDSREWKALQDPAPSMTQGNDYPTEEPISIPDDDIPF